MTVVDSDLGQRERLRGELNAQCPWWYSPLAHAACPASVGFALVAASLYFLEAPKWYELIFAVFIFLLSNATEWRAHRDLLHKRTFPLAFLYDRHTPEHHSVFVRDDLAIRDRKEFRLVLIPAYGVALIFFVTLPITLGLLYAGERNLACLFVATTMGYTASYEILHLSFHLPPESFIGRRRVIRFLRRHHATHHHPPLMQKWNFNVVLPLWDLVRGTYYRGPEIAKI